MRHSFGCLRDEKDDRDFLAKAPERKAAVAYPATFSFAHLLPAHYNQGRLGSCVAHACGAALQMTEIEFGAANSDLTKPSFLQMYWWQRFIDGNLTIDSGSYLRTGMKQLAKYGACRSATWPYVVKKYKVEPSAEANAEAAKHRITEYARVNRSIESFKEQLFANNPIVFGFTVYESIYDIKKDGMLKMPGKGEEAQGGHAVMMVGWDDRAQVMRIRNSWGSAWGYGGDFFMPYAYLLDENLSHDFWTLIR
jgi:C1A family cysteine protease